MDDTDIILFVGLGVTVHGDLCFGLSHRVGYNWSASINRRSLHAVI